MIILNDYFVWGVEITAIVIQVTILVLLVLQPLRERRAKDK